MTDIPADAKATVREYEDAYRALHGTSCKVVYRGGGWYQITGTGLQLSRYRLQELKRMAETLRGRAQS